MDRELYTTAYDDGTVTVAAYRGAELDAEALAPVLAGLAPDTEPSGADRVVYFSRSGRWGRIAFAKAGLFAKALYACRFVDRDEPFGCVGAVAGRWERCSALGLPVPAYRGAFAVRRDGKWLWGGILSEYLDGWRELAPAGDADAELAEGAIGAFSAAGACNLDMHCANVMTDGRGDALVVDLDDVLFGVEPEKARATMEDAFAESRRQGA